MFGEGPPAYLLEVVVRVVVVYLIIFVSIRLLGKRMIAEMGRADLVAKVSMAAAVGLAIQRPGRGILVSTAIVFVIVCVGRWLAKLAYRNRWFEKAYQGVDALVITDGVIDQKRLVKVEVTKERLFAALRAEGIRHLGQVQRFYMEADGKFSLVIEKDAQPGLSVIPEWDQDLVVLQKQTELMVCVQCGYSNSEINIACLNCGTKEYTKSITL